MKKIMLMLAILLPGALSAQNLPVITPKPVTDDYFGTKITDPYRNIENLEDPEVKTWMKAHSDYARKTLDAIPGRQGLIDKMKDFDSRRAARIMSLKILENDMYFYFKIRPEDQQAKLYYRQGYKGQEVLLFDPETYEKGQVYTVSGFSPSRDGSKLAFTIARKGSEVGTTLIMSVKDKKIYPEQLKVVL
jgi:prolyl oligopeptidase